MHGLFKMKHEFFGMDGFIRTNAFPMQKKGSLVIENGSLDYHYDLQTRKQWFI